MNESRSFSIKTLGCKLNQYESSQMSSLLVQRGWHAVPFGARADLVIVHTCTVTDNSDRKCRNYIRQGARSSVSGGVVVTGCMGRRDPASVESMDEVIAFIDHKKEKDICTALEQAAGVVRTEQADDASIHMKERVRAHIKIQDGCDGKCSYCIVPSVRGEPVSRPFREILKNAKELISAGVPEIVFTGITIGRYDDDRRDLAALAEAILSLPGDFRLRITSIEPRHVTEKLVSLFGHPKLCDHIHLPLQSGSNRILEKMNRPYTREDYIAAVNMFREKLPRIAIGADIIVGYPGETDEDFEQTLDVVRRAALFAVHQFSYSARSGTVSSGERPCPPKAVADRSAVLRDLSHDLQRAYERSFNGEILPSVIEKEHGGVTFALTSNYLKVRMAQGSACYEGKIIPVRIDAGGDMLLGKAVV